tara:strand:- start:42 stop:773 length:732 start_codon:yes stop_codon:yes gene_type:complete
MNNKIKLRTRLKHLYFKIKKNFLNTRLSFFTYPKYLKLKRNGVLPTMSLQDFYTQNNIKILEGNSTQSKNQEEFLINFSGGFKNILEIGFNGGHSSELFLKFNPESTITSIDLGYWYYCKFGSEFLRKCYPGRTNIIFKDSINALKDFNTLSQGTYFDLIYIDGNHTYEYALSDMLNCKKFSYKETVVLLDDVVADSKYRTLSNSAPTKVWNELLNQNFIIEIETKHFKDINRGIAIGKYNFN